MSVVKESAQPLTPQQILDELIRHHPHLYDTPAQRESVKRKHHSHVSHALLAQIYTFVGDDPRFTKDQSVTPYRVSLANAGNDAWTNEELRASVECYLEMRDDLFAGHPVVKSEHYQHLADRFGRTSKAFEYRMQNISYVLSVMGRSWIPGLKPARNVGTKTAGKIEALIAELEGKTFVPVAAFELEARAMPKAHTKLPTGAHEPRAITATITQYVRDPAVKSWVLAQAKGVCECCEQPAPFETPDGPYLEVHHVRQLADKGADTICNAIAICPNCHRRLHHGIDAGDLLASIKRRIERLHA